MGAHGELTGEGKEGGRGRRRGTQLGDAAWGGGASCGGLLWRGLLGAAWVSPLLAWALCSCVLYVRRTKEGGRRKREEKKRKEKKREKRKNIEIFPNLKFFGEKKKDNL
jgi:hypothetical protein